MSVWRFGFVDIDGLWRVRAKHCREQQRSIDERPDVLLSRSESYHRHEPWTEYLVANPMVVPGLRALIKSCRRRRSATETVFNETDKPKNPTDPFNRLPQEILDLILAQADSKSIASLRLASRFFTQLSQTNFRNLIRKEMP